MHELRALRSVTRDPAVLAASLVANLLALAVPLAMLQIYDRVIPNAAHETLIVLTAMVAFALLTDCALRLSRSRLLAFFAARFESQAYSRALWSVIMQDPTQRKRVDGGTLVTRLSSVDRLRSQRADGAAGALLDLPFAVLFLVVIAFLSPTVAIAVALMLTVTFFVLRGLRRRIDAARRERFGIEARRYSFVREVLGGIRSIRAIQIGSLMSRRQERLLGQSAVHTTEMTRRVQQAQGITAAISNLTPLLTASTAGWLVLTGEASIGVLAAVVVLSGRIVQPVLRMEGFLSSLESTREAEADFRALTDVPLQQTGEQTLECIDTLEICQVTTDPDPEFGIALKNINLTLRKGDCLLLQSDDPVGLDVAAQLFTGRIALAKGWITANGRALSAFSLEDRQTRIRLLPKDAQLLEGTLFDNACALRPERNGQTALTLARELGLQKVMRQNPMGLQARVGPEDDGLPQSAKRITANIAGLATKPDVIVFLAANSGLDQETDQQLLNWLKRHAAEHILILATNRPSYAALATQTLDLSLHCTTPQEV
ncbi:ABC transporter transmembrane domain-containing protein [uncultured Roseobacter sp.]|uniref:ABC transporter transmembrane domain-containing protein n=1 Tax=uncultured Roseobacter sp. TaxID=114847 RepID=UPI00261935B7|nr:ABC transporter transmembrane domain-containing protein [uncultured Roseobacter sp.]